GAGRCAGATRARVLSTLMEFQLATVAKALSDAGVLVDHRGDLPPAALGITDDSRMVRPGSMFIAVRGTEHDGHDYLAAAHKAGASAAIVEDAERAPAGMPLLVVREGRRAAPIAAAAAYNWPVRELRVVGATGTNGKTTTVSMLRHLLDTREARSASIGTLGVLIGSEGRPMEGGGGLTTPGPVELQRVLRALVDERVGAVAMEVSSHSLDQRRVDGIPFSAAVFTNLTRDHLDYHGTMEAYFAAKALLLDLLAPDGVVVYNLDAPIWEKLRTERRRVSFSERATLADVRAEGVRFTPRGSEWALVLGRERFDVRLPLIG